MDKKICMIAHRGYSGKYHENTEQAFTEAARHGSGGAETDIRRTKDGVYVCSHNGSIIQSDGTELAVSEHTYSELIAKPLKNKRTDDEVFLCTFRRYLEIMKQNNMVCFVELKGDFSDGEVKEIFKLAEEVYDLSKCILQSFSVENLKKARELFPSLPLMLTYGCSESGYEICFEYGFSIDCDYKALTPQMIKEFHERNLEVAVWTVNDPDDFDKVKTWNLEYIESDNF